MELANNRSIKFIFVLYLFYVLTVISGCGKYFWEYECVWMSDSPYIYMPAGNHTATVELNGEKRDVFTSWENTGRGIYFCDTDIDDGQTAESIIWETECKIKKGKLYITIIKDNVSDMEGETIVLEQQPLEEDSDEK